MSQDIEGQALEKYNQQEFMRTCLPIGRQTNWNVLPSSDSRHSDNCELGTKFGAINFPLTTTYVLYGARVLLNCTALRPGTEAES